MREAKLFYNGSWREGAATVDLRDKFDDHPVAVVHEASPAQVTEALAGVAAGQGRHILLPHDRYRVLARASELVAARRDEFVETLITDSGFTLADARREVDRAVQTLLVSGEEAKRVAGEVVPLHGAPGWNGRYAMTTRHPLGVVCAITPFNSPLNTVAHKVAPALAAGNSVIVKPASYTPLTTGLLVTTLLDAGLPEQLIAVVNGRGDTVGQALLESPVPAFYAFTGSTVVGERLHRTVGMRKTQLELGSLSSTIICADADLELAAPLCANAAFRKAGQVCTSVQRLYVHRAIQDDFVEALTRSVAERGAAGDPRKEETFVGPVISDRDADRIEQSVGAAVAAGAGVVTGGKRDYRVIAPTVLSDVALDTDVMSREIFGPVVAVRPFDDLGAAIKEINDTPYGLAAGIFTRDLNHAFAAAGRLRMGSVHINETSSSRVDLMPYGGVKRSGSGLEGPRYALEEMSEQRLITFGPG